MNRQVTSLLDLIYEEPYKIAQFVGFSDFRKFPHNIWMQRILFSKKKTITLQAHRGSYKTTALSVCVALIMLLFPTRTILLIRKTENDITTFVSQVKNILMSDTFHSMAAILYDGHDLIMTRATSFSLDTSLNQAISGACQFDALSLTGSLTGKHADIVITDDIVTLKDRVSRAEREQTKRQYMELRNVVNRGGRTINTGTPWHKEDAFLLMGDIERYSIYETGMITKEEEEELRRSMSPSLFAANYELKHIADEESLFDAPRFYDGDIRKIYQGIGHIDAAYGGGDYTAYTVIRKADDTHYLVFGKLWGKHVDDCLGEISAYQKALRVGTIYTEKNADKGYLRKELIKRMIPAKTYSENMNKFIKISTYLRSNWENIYFLRDTDPEYIQQILDYTENAEHDDAPDSLACCIRRFKKGARYL